jgi:signal transduction histidine kinase
VLLRRQEDLRELREEKDRMQALLQAIPDGVAVITEDGCVVTYNQMLLRMLQLEGKSALDKAISDKFHALVYAPTYQKTAKIHEKLMDDVLAHITKEKENTSIDFGSVLCGGHFLEWRCTISHWSRVKACILVVRDVGEWVGLEALAKKESEAKSALIRSVSHELRTPINAIINISETLLENEFLREQDKENCRMLVSSSNFLLSNVNDLLDFSRIANQKSL